MAALLKERASEAYDSDAYQQAYRMIEPHVERDIRFVEGSTLPD